MPDLTDQNRQPTPSHQAATSPFLSLPFELKLIVVSKLAIKDLLNVRLVAVSWAKAGAGSLFRNGFSVRPQHDDMTRLQNVCSNPEIAKGIGHLEFYVGDINPEQFISALVRAGRERKRGSDFDTYTRLVSNVHDAVFKPERFQRHCDKSILEQCFSRLSNLTSITITSSKSPFSAAECPTIAWEMVMLDTENFEKSHSFDSTISRKRYICILLAALKLSTPIEKLTLDSIPVDCFYVDRNLETANPGVDESAIDTMDICFPTPNEVMKNALLHVKDLRVGFIGAGDFLTYDDIHLARALGDFVCSFQNLRSLELSWMMEDNETDEFIKEWEKSFFKNKFQHLERFCIESTETSDKILLPFLYRHANTLKRLQLGENSCYLSLDTYNEGVADRTWKAMLTDIRDNVKNLEKFEFLAEGDVVRIYDNEWNDVEGSGSTLKSISSTKLLEMYVLRRIPWPMFGEDPRFRAWNKKFVGTYLQLIELREADLASLLSDEWETDQEDWSDDYDYPMSDGDELLDPDGDEVDHAQFEDDYMP